MTPTVRREHRRVEVVFRFVIGFQRDAAELKRFSISVVTPAILTPELFFQCGTLEFAMRNVFQHNGWEKILARSQYLVHLFNRLAQAVVVYLGNLVSHLPLGGGKRSAQPRRVQPTQSG